MAEREGSTSPEEGEATPKEQSATAPGEAATDQTTSTTTPTDPPLPDEPVPSDKLAGDPPLPNEPPPSAASGEPSKNDDGWEPVWEPSAGAFYFYNKLSGASTWENPRVPSDGLGIGNHDREKVPKQRKGGYDPAIHGDYDPTASYAREYEEDDDPNGNGSTAPDAAASAANPYGATGQFNRFTGKWQRAELQPDNFNDENKSKRQLNAFFDYDAAANSHDGRSLKAERAGKKLTKKEVKNFKEKRREKKEEKRRAWLRD